jgi:hypothetical protein
MATLVVRDSTRPVLAPRSTQSSFIATDSSENYSIVQTLDPDVEETITLASAEVAPQLRM